MELFEVKTTAAEDMAHSLVRNQSNEIMLQDKR